MYSSALKCLSGTAVDCHDLFLRGQTTSGVYSVQPAGSEPFSVFCEMTAGEEQQHSPPFFNTSLFLIQLCLGPDGGWTVIQRRQDGSVDFDQLWAAYEKGFGSLEGKCALELKALSLSGAVSPGQISPGLTAPTEQKQLWALNTFLTPFSSPPGEFWLGLQNIHSIVQDNSYVLSIQLSDWGEDFVSVHLPIQLGGKQTNYSLLVQEPVAANSLQSSLGSDSAAAGLSFSTPDRDNDLKVDISCAKLLSGWLQQSKL